jgi:hypothetical protein
MLVFFKGIQYFKIQTIGLISAKIIHFFGRKNRMRFGFGPFTTLDFATPIKSAAIKRKPDFLFRYWPSLLKNASPIFT